MVERRKIKDLMSLVIREMNISGAQAGDSRRAEGPQLGDPQTNGLRDGRLRVTGSVHIASQGEDLQQGNLQIGHLQSEERRAKDSWARSPQVKDRSGKGQRARGSQFGNPQGHARLARAVGDGQKRRF